MTFHMTFFMVLILIAYAVISLSPSSIGYQEKSLEKPRYLYELSNSTNSNNTENNNSGEESVTNPVVIIPLPQ